MDFISTQNSMPISCPMLHIDVFESIIDQSCDDTTSLRHLSLSCSALQPRARYHLFRSIIIKTLQQIETSREFLDSRPWFPRLVRKVILSTAVPARHLSRNVRILDVVPVHLLSQLPNLHVWKMELKDDGNIDSAWLSFHRSALSCYQKCGRRTNIRHLELSYVPFENISDFIRLVSAFSSIESLTCSRIPFRSGKPSAFFPHPIHHMTVVAPRLRLKHLCISSSVGPLAVEYLLAYSAATLNSLVMTIDRSPLEVGRDYTEQLEVLISQLFQLSSLAFVILPHGRFPFRENGILPDIGWTTRILERVTRAPLRDVLVELKPDILVRLGSPPSYDSAPLALCKALDKALLRFTLGRIVIHHPPFRRRAGRAQFWATAIKHAFPGLDKGGSLIFNRSNCKVNTPEPVGHERSVECLVPSHDSKRVVSISQDGTIIAWNTQSGMIAHEWFAHAEGLGRGSDTYDLALSPDSLRLVSVGVGGSEAPLKVWDLTDGAHRAAAPEGYTDLVMFACAWSPDGELIASASSSGTVRVWDALTFQQRDVHDDTGFHPKHLQFSPNARYLVWTSSSINIWSRPEEDQPKRQRPLVQLNYDAAINALSFNPESTRIVTAHGHSNGTPEDYVVRIWDIATGAVLALLAGHTAIVEHASFSPDGRSILSIQASPDGLARIWDAVSWRETLSFKTDGGTGCFSPCGKYIVTRGAQVKLWRASDGLWLVTFTEHKGYVSHVVFSPNGEFLASGDLDGIVHIRRLSNFL